jgi:hypothetical protein
MESMNRRELLQSLIAAAVLVRVPGPVREAVPVAEAAPSLPTPALFTGEAGRAIPIGGRAVSEGAKLARKLLIEDARRHLPPGTRFEVRVALPEMFGRSNRMAWYAAEGEMQEKPADDVQKMVFDNELGLFHYGRYIA